MKNDPRSSAAFQQSHLCRRFLDLERNITKLFQDLTCTRAGLAACKNIICRKYSVPPGWITVQKPCRCRSASLVLFAHLGFHEDFDEKALAEEFHDVTGADLNDFLELDALDSLFQNGQPNLDTDNPSKYLLYQDPLLGIFDRHIEDLDLDTERYYQDLADRLEICRKHTPAYETLFAFYHSLASTLAGKADLGVRLKKHTMPMTYPHWRPSAKKLSPESSTICPQPDFCANTSGCRMQNLSAMNS